MIHRLYPIINIHTVVCTNTPSNHGGFLGRRIIFNLGSVVGAVPPPSHRLLLLLYVPEVRAQGAARALPWFRDPTGKGGTASPVPFSVPGFVWLQLLSSPRHPPHLAPSHRRLPPAGLRGGKISTTSPALFLPLSRHVWRTPPPLQGLVLRLQLSAAYSRRGCWRSSFHLRRPSRPARPATSQAPVPATAPRGNPVPKWDSAGAGCSIGGRGHRRAASRQNGRGMQVGEVEGAARSQLARFLQQGCQSCRPFPARSRGHASRSSPCSLPRVLIAVPSPPTSGRAWRALPMAPVGARQAELPSCRLAEPFLCLSACPSRTAAPERQTSPGGSTGISGGERVRSKANTTGEHLSFAFVRKQGLVHEPRGSRALLGKWKANNTSPANRVALNYEVKLQYFCYAKPP